MTAAVIVILVILGFAVVSGLTAAVNHKTVPPDKPFYRTASGRVLTAGEIERLAEGHPELRGIVGKPVLRTRWGTLSDAAIDALADTIEVPSTPVYRTASGRELTDADIQALADEAEQGYDVTKFLPRDSKDL